MNDNYIQGLKISLDNLDKNSYVRNIDSLKDLNELVLDTPITFFVGENGSGKSTLLEGIAESYGFNKEGGTRNYNFSTYNEASPLKDAITLYKGYKRPFYNYFFRAETFFNVASIEEEYAKNGVRPSEKYHEKSHGEGFLHLFKSFTDKSGLFLMDEPEAALSPSRQLTLFSLISEASKQGSQFIIISHSPILLGIPNSKIFVFNNEGIKEIAYEDTDSYKITKMFIEHKQTMIDELTK